MLALINRVIFFFLITSLSSHMFASLSHRGRRLIFCTFFVFGGIRMELGNRFLLLCMLDLAVVFFDFASKFWYSLLDLWARVCYFYISIWVSYDTMLHFLKFVSYSCLAFVSSIWLWFHFYILSGQTWFGRQWICLLQFLRFLYIYSHRTTPPV